MIIISYLISFISSAIIGIDLGSDHARASALIPGAPLDILLNRDSKRYFDNFLTVIPQNGNISDIINASNVKDYQFSFADSSAARKYPNYTIYHWINYISKLPNENLINSLRSRLYFPVLSLFQGQRLAFAGVLPDVVFLPLLNDINESLQSHSQKAKIDNTVIAVPQYFPQVERDTLKGIARYFGFKPIIVDSNKAAATYFLLENQRLVSQGPISVFFIDFGASSIQATLYLMTRTTRLTLNEISYAWSDKVGGRDFDVIIYNLLLSQYQYRDNITERGEQLLLQEAVKIKHRLTLNKEAVGLIDAPDGIHDFNYKISRSEFEKESQPLLKIIKSVLQKASSQQSFTGEFHSTTSSKVKIDRVQFIGASTRMLCFQHLVKTLYGEKAVSFSTSQINIEEAIAIGSSYIGAAGSHDYQIPPIAYETLDLYKVELVTNNNNIVPFSNILPTSGAYWIRASSINPDHLPYPDGSSIYWRWGTTNLSTRLVQTKDNLWRFRNSTSKMSRPWKFQSISVSSAISRQIIQKRKLEEAINNFDTLLLETREIILDEDKLLNYTTDRERKLLANAINVTDRWYMNQKQFVLEQVQKRHNALEDAVGDIMCRVQNPEKLAIAKKHLYRLEKKIKKSIKNWKNKDEKHRPLRSEIRTLLRKIARIKMSIEEKERIQNKLDSHINPAFKWYELENQIDVVERYFLKIVSDLSSNSNKAQSNQDKDVYVYPPQSANVQYN